MADVSLDDFVKKKKFGDFKKATGGGGRQIPKASVQNGVGPKSKSVGDLRTVLAKKQMANVTDLRAKLKPKALYTKKLASRAAEQHPPQQPSTGSDRRKDSKGQGRKPLKLTSSFKNSISTAVSESTSKTSRSSRSSSYHQRSKSSSSKLPSYEEAKKISVTVPGLSRPASEVR